MQAQDNAIFPMIEVTTEQGNWRNKINCRKL